MERRNFLGTAGKAAIVLSFLGSGIYSLVKALIPGVYYEPPSVSSLGRIEKYPEGVTFIPEHRLFIIREGNEIRAVSAICTHLGCTVNYVPLPKTKDVRIGNKPFKEDWEFSCPCHGSKYFFDGTNYAGPAPKALPCLYVDISLLTGELVVDKARIVERTYRLAV